MALCAQNRIVPDTHMTHMEVSFVMKSLGDGDIGMPASKVLNVSFEICLN